MRRVSADGAAARLDDYVAAARALEVNVLLMNSEADSVIAELRCVAVAWIFDRALYFSLFKVIGHALL